MKQKPLWKKFESHLLNEGLTSKRITKLNLLYRTAERGIKNFEKATKEEITQFIDKLNKDKFRKLDGTKYSGNTKSDIKKFIKQLWKWLEGDNEQYPKKVSWIRTRIGKDEKPTEKEYLSLEELRKFVLSFQKLEYRIAVLILFDSGFRISELLSVKKKDLTFESFGEDKCFWIKCNDSKTEIRKVPIPLFTEDIQSFYNSLSFQNLKDDDKLFSFKYGSFTKWLRDKSLKILGKKITPHCLRHSSATHYAKEYEGDSMLLADKYGWAYNSKELNTYIRRSGTRQNRGAKKVFNNELMKLRKEHEQLKAVVEKFVNSPLGQEIMKYDKLTLQKIIDKKKK